MSPINDRDTTRRVDLDTVFRALSHSLRRRILTALMTDNPRRAEEFETVEFKPDGSAQEPIQIELRHRHLPQLDEAGFIDWDEQAGRVTRGEDFAEVRPLLELMDEHAEELPADWP